MGTFHRTIPWLSCHTGCRQVLCMCLLTCKPRKSQDYILLICLSPPVDIGVISCAEDSELAEEKSFLPLGRWRGCKSGDEGGLRPVRFLQSLVPLSNDSETFSNEHASDCFVRALLQDPGSNTHIILMTLDIVVHLARHFLLANTLFILVTHCMNANLSANFNIFRLHF